MDAPEGTSILNARSASQPSLLARRHKSFPSRPSHSANPSTIDPASPEVISSLISSLSTISIPLQSHFDNVPLVGSHTDLSSPESLPTRNSFDHLRSCPSDHASLNDHGFGVTYGAYKPPDEPTESPFLHPDDAAIAPVVRMARSPTSPKSPKSRPSLAAEPSPARPASRGSYASSSKTACCEGDSTFGMITAEPGPRLSTAISVASSSSGGRMSLKSPLCLLKKSSREFATDKQRQADRLRKRSSYNDSLKRNVPRNRASLRSMRSMADLAEEGWSGSFAMEPHKEDVASTVSSSMELQSQLMSTEGRSNTPAAIASGKVIPTRESSLRHSYSSNSKKHRSSRHSRYSSISSSDFEVGRSVFGTGNETDQIMQRIQELKDQRQKNKNEHEKCPNSPKSMSAIPTKQTGTSQFRSGTVDREPLLQNGADGANDYALNFEESAPAPAVMTGKSSTRSRSSNVPLGASNAINLQPPMAKPPLEKPEQVGKRSSRHSFEHSTPLGAKRHSRFPSNPASPPGASIGHGRPSSADSIDDAVFAYVTSPKLTQKVTHPTTGRIIAFSEVGDPKGHVVLCCLGMGLTRYLMGFYDELARTLRLRLITLDRPGVGESGPYLDEPGTPLSWPDDVAIVCNHLRVTKFSILAHSAGAIYALATALRIPQHIRGRIHLLAPWIPPSQLSSISTQKVPVPANAVPYSQRILRALPPSILKVASSSFLTATSASITANLPKSSRRNKRKGSGKDSSTSAAVRSDGSHQKLESEARRKANVPKTSQTMKMPAVPNDTTANADSMKGESFVTASHDRERQIDYDTRLTHKIWELATTNANPAVDLLVCLERRQEIGFRYVDITRHVVIHHGSRDTRVPVENVRWLGKTMRRCEVRVLEGEGHGLMASAAVMGGVLMEIGKEWEDWMKLVQGKRRATVTHAARSGIMIQSS